MLLIKNLWSILDEEAMARDIDILVLSDLHLGTNQCRAGRLYKYLKSVNPKMLILNGDIIDIWLLDFKKWPKKHTKVLAYLFNLMTANVPIYYLPGNHDDYLKQFDGLSFNNFKIQNELTLDLNGRKTWFMHGDKHDKSVNGTKRDIAIRAGKAFDSFVGFNRFINGWENFLGVKDRTNFSKSLKDRTKSAIKKNNDFEQQYIEEAALNKVDTLVCGHVHQPGMTKVSAMQNKRHVDYLNSGDWTENCTSLEYVDGKWTLYRYRYNYTKHESVLKNVRFTQSDIYPFLEKQD
ncbi:UDP-2,3-diacylglucosamine diphosphatase [Chitinophagales bacterium]|nr:UDP-2,3-diacylglucosamine diphosphatase [Chitinophagales bacterium]